MHILTTLWRNLGFYRSSVFFSFVHYFLFPGDAHRGVSDAASTSGRSGSHAEWHNSYRGHRGHQFLSRLVLCHCHPGLSTLSIWLSFSLYECICLPFFPFPLSLSLSLTLPLSVSSPHPPSFPPFSTPFSCSLSLFPPPPSCSFVPPFIYSFFLFLSYFSLPGPLSISITLFLTFSSSFFITIVCSPLFLPLSFCQCFCLLFSLSFLFSPSLFSTETGGRGGRGGGGGGDYREWPKKPTYDFKMKVWWFICVSQVCPVRKWAAWLQRRTALWDRRCTDQVKPSDLAVRCAPARKAVSWTAR